MDGMTIKNSFIKGIINRVAKGLVKKYTGVEVDPKLNELNIKFEEDKAHVHIELDATMSKKELESLVKKLMP